MSKWNQFPGGSEQSLDDILQQAQQQLKRFKGAPVLILAAVAVVGIIVWTAWFTLQPEETGVVQRFGKVIRTAGPGLHFKLPFGVETVRLLPTARVLKEEFGFRTLATVPGEKTRYDPGGAYKDESLMLTGDLNVIDVQWVIQYRIEDPIRYLFQVRDTPKTIRYTTEAIMRRAVGNRLGSDVLTTGRVAVASEAKEEIQGKADADATRIYGMAYNRNPEFYAFLRTLESYKEKTNMNSVMILTTDSDFYQYIKKAIPEEVQGLPAPASQGTTP